MVDRFCRHARRLADGVAGIPGTEVLNDVEFTQVCVNLGSGERTQAVVRAVLADGTTWMSGSRWRGRAVLRVSVSNWSTTDKDVNRSLTPCAERLPQCRLRGSAGRCVRMR